MDQAATERPNMTLYDHVQDALNEGSDYAEIREVVETAISDWSTRRTAEHWKRVFGT